MLSQRNKTLARTAPKHWAKMNIGTSEGRMPEKVSLSERAMVTAGLAKDVDAANQ